MGRSKLVVAALLAVLAIGLAVILYGCMEATVIGTTTTTPGSTTTTIFGQKSWGSPTQIGENVKNVDDPHAVIDDNGNIIAVWAQQDGAGIKSIYSNRYVTGAGWGTPEVIENGDGVALWTDLAIDSSGNAIAVWGQENAGVSSIYANRYVAGSGWGTAVLIESGTGNAEFPKIAVNNNGNAFAVWMQKDDGSGITSIYSNRYVAGSGWKTATLIESSGIEAAEPRIAMDSSGNAIAVWVQLVSEGTNENMQANRYVAGSGWGTAADIGIVSGEIYNEFYNIAMDGSGKAIVVWPQYDGTIHNVYANRYVPGSGWGTALTIENAPGHAMAPYVAVDGSGNAIAVWIQHDGTRRNVLAKRFVSGSWETNITTIETDPLDCYLPKIAMNESGDAMVIWQSLSSVITLWANNYTSGSWGTSREIAGGLLMSNAQQIAINNNGDAVAVWMHGTGIDRGETMAVLYR